MIFTSDLYLRDIMIKFSEFFMDDFYYIKKNKRKENATYPYSDNSNYDNILFISLKFVKIIFIHSFFFLF